MDNDYELVYLAKENNEEAIEILYNKYFKLIYYKANKYCKVNTLNFDDYINIGNLTFYSTIDNYQDSCAFSTFLSSCLDNSMNNYYKSLEKGKNKALNEAVSLDDEIVNLSVSLPDNRYNPEDIVLEKYSYEILKNKIIEKLTWKEELILNLKEQNYSAYEISEIIDSNIKTIYTIISRIQKKVSNIMSICQ